MPKTKTSKPSPSLSKKKSPSRKRDRSVDILENLIVGIVIAAVVTTIAGLVYLSIYKTPNISDVFLRFQIAAPLVGLVAGVLAPRLHSFLKGGKSQRFYAGVLSAVLATAVSLFLIFFSAH